MLSVKNKELAATAQRKEAYAENLKAKMVRPRIKYFTGSNVPYLQLLTLHYYQATVSRDVATLPGEVERLEITLKAAKVRHHGAVTGL